MKRRSFLMGLGALISNGSLVWPALHSQRDYKSKINARLRPNILFLLADDLRADLLIPGNPLFTPTPHLDQLFSNAYNFQNSFVTTSICPSSRASYLSSQYTSKHKIWDFKTPISDNTWKQSLPQLLREVGYQLAFLGKWGIGTQSASKHYDYYDGFEGQGRYWKKDGRYLTESLAFQFQSFLDLASQEPWFAQISFKSPHVQDDESQPYPIPQAFENLIPTDEITKPSSYNLHHTMPAFFLDSEGRSRFKNRHMDSHYSEVVNRYRTMLRILDNTIGMITSDLESKGLLSNTIIIFASDNGLLLGEYGLAGKWWMFEPSIRVPLKISLPPSLENRKIDTDKLALNIDLAPSLLDLLDLDPPQSMQGLSLFNSAHRDAFYYEHQFQDKMNIAPCFGVRTKKYKFLEFPENEFEMLFDLESDPNELENLANSERHSRIKSQLKSLMEGLQRSVSN